MLSKRGTVARIYLPPDANCLLSVADHCLRSRNYVNLIVIDKQPQLQYFDHGRGASSTARRGASILQWASNDADGEPDVVLGAAGDIPTLETVAAAWWLRRLAPDLRVRVVNVVDLMRLFPAEYHPHGMTDERVRRAVHRGQARGLRIPRLPARDPRDRARASRRRPHFTCAASTSRARRPRRSRWCVLNGMSRYHLAAEAIRRVPRLSERAPELIADCESRIEQSIAYAYEHLEDPPEIRDWVWTD